ncbi:MAG: SDR family NAD(P)-dependent oxidoreductase [Pseudomonadota bacterium]
MSKTILITGATDGIGFETAKRLAAAGHTLLIHGRSQAKLEDRQAQLQTIDGAGTIACFRADLSRLAEVDALAAEVSAQHTQLDALINNAGVFKLAGNTTQDGLDLRFLVNTLAPYRLTQLLLPLMGPEGRIVNLSSAAQAPVDLQALAGQRSLGDGKAYAQSKLAITMWSFHLAAQLGAAGPAVIAVNPASFLASKMVKDAYGVAGNDLSIGADILVRAALDAEFADASGRYYDNDSRRFAQPHPDALDAAKNARLVATLDALLDQGRASTT